ncbi:MAG: PAS domain S-box protein, partial [Planctomycetes bacterium]|nr:PAS domain S-box protein [Planctomycetota bacterium]
AVAALRESEENYTAVVEQANDGVVVIQDGLYVYVNEAWAQTTGYSRDELMAMTIEDIVIPEHKTIVRERYELRMKGGTPPPLYDIRIQMKNGTIRDIEVSASIIRYHGQPADMAVVRDITERRQAEDALRESEEKFSKAFHSKAYLMALSSIDDGTYIDVNDGFVEVTGYTREEVIGRTSTSLNIFDDPEMRSIIIQSIKESGHARDLEITIRIKNGDLRHGLFAAELVSIKGTPCLLTTMSDVTERKQVDEKLRESERRYRTLVDNNPYGVQETDTSGMIVFANKAHDSIFGYDDGESIGKTIFDPLASDWERKRTWDYWVKLLEEQPLPETYYELGRTKDGQEIDLEVAWNYIRDEQGDIKGFISVLTDITDRKQVEKILKENEQKYRELVEGLDEAVYRMSLPDGKYDYFGPAAKNVFGWNAENFLGKPSFIAEIIHPDFHGYFQEKWADLIKGIIAPTYEFKIIDPENKERWIIQSNKGVFDNSGNIIAIEGLCRDITERKQAEEALRIEKDNLSNIFEAMEDGVYIVNQQNDIQYVNPVLKREYGIYEGRKCYEYFNDLKEACPWCKNHEVFAGKTVRWEWYSFKNQKTYDLIDTPLKNIDGSISKLEIFRDITERKQAEEQLEISERNYREIFDSSNDAIAVHDAIDGTILDVNQKLTEMFGYTYDETLNLTTGDLSQGEPPYSQKEAAEWIRKVIDEGPQLFEWLCKNKNGELFWSEVSLTHVSIGGKDRVLAVDRDITERKQAEESLRESESNLLQAQAIAHLGSFRLDLNTNIIHASEEMLKTYGWAPELSGKLTVEAWQLSVHPDDLDMVSAALENTATVGAPYDIEFRIYRTDGEMRIVHAQGELVRNPSGIPVSIVGTGLDITERKQAEEKIRRFNEELEQRVIERTYQLEAANKELEAFTYSVSHDLRAPLRHVSSFAEILQEEYSGSLPEDAHEHVTTIIESALKMNVLIDGLLGLSRMGRQELNIKSIKLKDIVEEVRKDLEPEVQGRKVKWKIGKLPTIEGDPVLMKAVIVNLLSNAVKFTRHSNPAIIEVSPLPDGKPGFLV